MATETVAKKGQIFLRNVRISFPNLYTAVQYQGQGKFAFGAHFIMTPDSAEKKLVDATIQALAVDKWKEKAAVILPTILGQIKQSCFLDGNLKAQYGGYAGNYVITAKRDIQAGRPVVIDPKKTPLTEKDGKPYSGCYVNAKVDIWIQDNAHGKAIRCTLEAVQFVRDGEAFSATGPATADGFDEVEEQEVANDLI